MLPDRPQRPLVGILGYWTALEAPDWIFSVPNRLYRPLVRIIGQRKDLPVWLERPRVEILG